MKRTGPHRRRIAVVVDRFYLRMRHPTAWRNAMLDAATRQQGFSSLRGHKYCLLSTFSQDRRGGPNARLVRAR